jgi:hypothetical protein
MALRVEGRLRKSGSSLCGWTTARPAEISHIRGSGGVTEVYLGTKAKDVCDAFSPAQEIVAISFERSVAW